MAFTKIHPLAFGLSLGALSGLAAFFMGFWAYLLHNGKPFIWMVGTSYISYNPSIYNCVVGGILAFVTIFISCFIISLTYNFLFKKI